MRAQNLIALRRIGKRDFMPRSPNGTPAALVSDVKYQGIAKIAVAVALAVAGWAWNPWRSIKHEPGVLVAAIPIQTEVGQIELPEVAGWKLKPAAEYLLRGRVLGTKRYLSGFGSDLVPIDVAVGWGRMSDQAVLDQFSLSMGNRFFFYEWSEEPAIPLNEIMRSASNNHVIAANKEVAKTIRSLVPGHVVTMRGYLVNASFPDGSSWNSSLRRDDTGNGACEVFYVQSITAAETAPKTDDATVASR